jgi:hypothetical protein
MQCKTPHKLQMAQGHDFGFGIVFIVFVGKCDRGIIDGFGAVITNGYFVGIPVKGAIHSGSKWATFWIDLITNLVLKIYFLG